MGLLLVHPKIWVLASVVVEKEVAERRVVETKGLNVFLWEVYDRVEIL